MASKTFLEHWNSLGINFPDVDLPKHNILHEGHLSKEQLLMEAIGIEAHQLDIPVEQLVAHYADDLARARELDALTADFRERKNHELEQHLREFRENRRAKQARRAVSGR